MIFNYGFSPEELLRSFDDLVRRHILGEQAVNKLMQFYLQKGLFDSNYKPSVNPAKEVNVKDGKVFELEGQYEPWVPERVDYLRDYR